MRTDPMASHCPYYIALLNDAMPITKNEWLTRCAARYQQRAGMDADEARQAAESSLENLDDDLTENPEDAADEDFTCWQD